MVLSTAFTLRFLDKFDLDLKFLLELNLLIDFVLDVFQLVVLQLVLLSSFLDILIYPSNILLVLGHNRVKNIGSRAELMGTTITVIQAKTLGDTSYPRIGRRKTTLDGSQHNIFVNVTIIRCKVIDLVLIFEADDEERSLLIKAIASNMLTTNTKARHPTWISTVNMEVKSRKGIGLFLV